MENRISFIVPTFNRGTVLLSALRTLFAQSIPAHEIIVVDQSTETSEDVTKQLQTWRQEGAIIWIEQSEPNASMARNRGALAASGDILVFLDDDIKVEHDFVEAYTRAFEDPAVRGVAGQVLEGARETVSVLHARAADSEIGWMFCSRNYDKPFVGSFLMAGNMGVRRDDFFVVGGMDERFYRGAFREESDFAMRWRKSGRVFHYRPDVSIYHLGGAGIAGGGARHWTRRNRWMGWHHYFGSWYFLLNHATWRSLPHLLAVDLRSAGINRRTLKYPWMIPFHLCRWLSALPYALWCRMKGPLLIANGPGAQVAER